MVGKVMEVGRSEGKRESESEGKEEEKVKI